MKEYSIPRKSLTLIVVFISLLISLSLISNALQNGYDLFQKALAKERGEGKLEEAIALYKKVIDETKDESLAAKAQLRIGICYEKLGMKEAQKAYQKVIDNYPSQTETVKVAKEKLSILVKAQTVIKKGDNEFKIRKVCELEDLLGEASPDRKYISYTDWGTGGLHIYEIATGKKRQLTEKNHYGAVLRSPWSPDSKQIAYNWNNEESFYDLRVINLNSSEPRVLYRDKDVYPQPADWSPDGKYILAILDNPPIMKKDNISQVGLISVEDGTVNILEALKGRDVYYMYFSPDGRTIAYDYPRQKGSQDSDIFLYSMEEKSETPLVEHSADDRLLGWTPDGRNILFVSDRMGTPDLWLLPVEEGKAPESPKIIKKNIGWVYPMEFALDGSFHYGQLIDIRDIYIATLDKEKGKLLAPPEKLAKRLVGSDFSPAWSPDGKSLAYVSKRHPQYVYGANSLYIVSMETGEESEVIRPQQLRLFGQFFGGLRWSPDGNSIIASGFEKDNKGTSIYLVDVKKRKMSLAFGGEASIPDRVWSLDGKEIFFSDYDWEKKNSSILVHDLETKQNKQIYHQDYAHISRICLSSEGRWLAFITTDPEMKKGSVIKILPVSGGATHDLVSIGTGCRSMVWAPEGRDIIYITDLITPTGKDRGSVLWKVSVEGGEPQKIWQTTENIEELRVHPDGQRIAFSGRKASCEIWVMENFLPKDKKEGKGGQK
jgi:Tol biopolymer transport system component